jgi:hypothetical protein
MLKCASAYTYEIDIQEDAFEEIKSQLDKKITLLENTVGIIMCHPEFITTGVLKHVCENLPFDVAGITTASQAVNDEAGEHIMTIFVMTSDDVRFKAGITGSLVENANAAVKAAYEKASAGEPAQPELALLFPPFLMEQFSGDTCVSAWRNVIPGTPFFGTYATDDTVTFMESETIFNGMSAKDAVPFVLCYGNIKPRFLIATLNENSDLRLRAVVTKSTNNIVHEINNTNTREFFTAKMGLPKSMLTFPLLVSSSMHDNNDGVPVVREHNFYTEEGASVFGGNIDEGAVISLLKFDMDSILSTSLNEIGKINGMPDVKGVLLFSCITRRMVFMGSDTPLTELQLAKDSIKQDIPFMMGYSGGEICPTSTKDGIPSNRFHDSSMVILII